MGKTVHFDVLAVAKATGFDEADRKIEHLSGTAEKSTAGLLVAAAAIAPAMIPIAAGAAAAGASFVALGAVGLLAFAGIKKEMAAGTPIGKEYAASIGTLKADLTGLEHTAAGGVLTGFQKSVQAIQPLMPTLNADTALLSAKLGDIVSHVMPGLVSLFTTANPLFLGFADDLDKGAIGFEHWAQSSDGAKKFVAYAQAELPKVEDFILSLATTVGHLAQGFAPFGGFILTDLTMFSKLINAIPISVLKVAAPAVISLVVAMKAMEVAGLIAPKIIALNGALVGFAAAETTVGAASLSLLTTLGPLAVAIGTIVAVSKGLEVVSQQFQQGSFMHDVLDPHNADILKVQGSGIDALRGAYSQLHGGVEGTAAQLLAWGSVASNAAIVTKQHYVSVKDLDKALADLRTQVLPATGALDDMGAATAAAIAKQKSLTDEMNKVKASAFSVTAQLGFLSAALDKLSNNAIDAAQIELQFKDALAAAKEQLKGNGSALTQNTVKGRANREWLLTQITTINQHAVAVGKQTGSVQKATAALGSDEAQLIRAAHAAGLNDSQVRALIKTYAATPKQVATKIKADTAAASNKIKTLQAQLDALHGKAINVDVYTRRFGTPAPGGGGRQFFASGGLVKGPGSGTSDSISARLSSGEFVMPAVQTAAFLPQLQAMRRTGPAVAARPGGMAAGGLVRGGQPIINVYVYGSVLSNEDLKRAMARGLSEWAASGHTLPIGKAIRP